MIFLMHYSLVPQKYLKAAIVILRYFAHIVLQLTSEEIRTDLEQIKNI